QNQNEPPINMSEVNPDHLTVMIEKAPGEALQALLPGHSISLTLRPQSETLRFLSQKNQIASFSSRGPDISHQLKPDIVAPGQDILAANKNAGYSRGLNGTSFSAPVVTGAAALIFQLHPTWTPRDVKSSLVNTADHGATWNGVEARANDTGNGRLNVEKAAGTPALIDPVSLSFGVIEQAPSQDLETLLKVTNPSSTASQTVSAEFVETAPHPSVQLSVTPLALTLGPGQSGQFTVKAHVVTPLQYGAFEGYLRFSSSLSSAPATASYWGAFPVPDYSQLLKVSQDGSASYSTLSAAVLAARPGATIEIQDSASYAGSLVIGTNLDGLPVHGLKLRARSGQSPVLRPGSSSPGIVLSGVRDVTLDGITIAEGEYGIIGEQSTGTLANSLIDSNRIGVGLENSQLSLRNTTIKRSTSTAILAFFGRLNLADTTIQENAGEGIWTLDSPALIQRTLIGQNKMEGIYGIGESMSVFDSTFEKNQATGLMLIETSMLVKGSLIQDTTGQDPDGISALGAMTLRVQDSRIQNNSRYGLAADLGPDVHFSRNRVTGNRSYGFFLADASGTVDSSWLTGNGRGIRIESSDLDLSNSVISGSTSFTDGDGIYADQGRLAVRNTTIAKNQRRGVRIAGSEHLVANSILYQNGAGDLEGGEQSSIQNNIISDGVFAGTNGNMQTDPRFRD
ncbi:MAG: hypothetical protein EHM18_11645, partial [Acidobacteria bacterium]